MYPTILRIAAGAAAAMLLAAGVSLVRDESAVPAPTDPPAAKPATAARANPRIRGGREAIEAALDRNVADGFAFVETPLSDVAAYVQDHYKIPVVLNRRELADVGRVPEDTPVTFQVSDISLRNALRALLPDLDLTFAIHHDVLLITTPERMESDMLVTRAYDVADLVTCRDPRGWLWDDYQSLIDIVVRTAEPDTWGDMGGPGTIEGLSIPGAKALVIRQNDDVHRKIARLLDELRKLRADRPAGNLPPLREYQPPRQRPFVISSIPVVGTETLGQSAAPAGDMAMVAGLPLDGHKSAVPAPNDPPAAKPATAAGANPAGLDAKPHFRAGREAIERALDGKLADGFAFAETPLADVAAYVQDRYEIPVVLDRRELEEVGVVPENTLVTFQVSGISLRNALRALLDEHDLALAIHHDVLLISTPERVQSGTLASRVFDVADLVITRDEHGRLWDDYPSLIDVVVNTVEPYSWQDDGGPGTIEGLSTPGAKTLIIRQTDDIHRAVARLLDDLRRLRADRPGGNLPPFRTYRSMRRGIGAGPIPVVGEQVRAEDAGDAVAVEPPSEAPAAPSPANSTDRHARK